MRLAIVFAVRAPGPAISVFLEDTCAGGSWSADERRAKMWDTREEMIDELEAAEIFEYANGTPLEIVEVIQRARE